MAQLSVPEQVLNIMPLASDDQLELLTLAPNPRALVQALPAEQVYQLIKEVDEQGAVTVLSCATSEQIQFILDVEMWRGDMFEPKKAVDWLLLLDQCEGSKIVEWFLTEEFEQKVMVLQSLIIVYKDDEMTDSYAGVEDLDHFTLDGIYDIFLKVPEAEPALNKAFKLLMAENQKTLYALLEAVIWYPVTQTVESAYRWRLARVGEKGIPEFSEAYEIYSRLDPDSLNLPAPSGQEFQDEKSQYPIAPYYPIIETDPSSFLGQCLAMLNDPRRFNIICWELVYLANKVMVADRADASDLETRNEIMRKALGYINLGLELGAGQDIAKGEKLLRAAWMQSLFQVGYGKIMQLRAEAHRLIEEDGLWLKNILNPNQLDHLTALVNRFPKIGVIDEDEAGQDDKRDIHWRDLKSLKDIQTLEKFIPRMKFYARFSRKVLDLTEDKVSVIATLAVFPENKKEIDMACLLTTALARFSMFKEIECGPLAPEAAKTFLELIFLPGIFPEENRICNEEIIRSFQARLMTGNMAWTGDDKEFLSQLIREITVNLELQYGRLDLKVAIEWKYTRGLCIKNP